MSLVVHCWQHEAPSYWRDIEPLHRRLLQQPSSGVPSAFTALQGELARLLPGADWPEGPPEPPDDSLVWSMQLDEGQLDTDLPVLVRAAAQQGLSVYVDVSGELFLPTGQVLSPEGRRFIEWPDADAPGRPPLSIEEVHQQIEQQLGALLAQHGFTCAPAAGSFARQVPAGAQQVVFVAAENYSEPLFFRLHPPLLRFELALPEALRRLWRADSSTRLSLAAPGEFNALAVEHDRWGQRFVAWENHLLTAEQLQRWLTIAARHVQQDLLPLLDAVTSANGYLEHLVLKSPVGFRHAPSPQDLLLGFWAGHPDLEGYMDGLTRLQEYLGRDPHELLFEARRRAAPMFGAMPGSALARPDTLPPGATGA